MSENILTKEEIDKLVAQRTEYKNNKQFDKADEIRELLGESYVYLHDSGGMTTWFQDLPSEPKAIRFTEPFERDYKFYLANMEKFSFDGGNLEEILFDKDGLTAKEVFFLYETRGEIEPTKEVDLFQKLVRTKGSINLHLKMWVDGVCEGDFTKEELFSGFIGEIPEWAHISFNNQVLKKCEDLMSKRKQPDLTLFYVKYIFENNNGYDLKSKENTNG